MNTNKRRDFLRKMSFAPLGVMAAKNAFTEVSEVISEAPKTTTTSRIKLSLNAWSYNVPLFKYVKGEEGGMSLFDLLEECARLNFDAVDPTGYFFPGYPEVPKSKFINEFKRRAFQLGLDISGTGIRNDFATADANKRKADVVLAKRWIEAAAEIGAPVLRLFAGHQPESHSWDDAAVWMSEAFAECAEHGEKYGVLVGVQNHGGMLKSADEVFNVLDRVDSDWFGVIADTGYFLTPDPYDDIKRMVPRAVNWQVKELLQNGDGDLIDLDRLVEIIRASNYRGYMPIETLPMPGKKDSYNVYTRVPEFLAEFRKALGQ